MSILPTDGSGSLALRLTRAPQRRAEEGLRDRGGEPAARGPRARLDERRQRGDGVRRAAQLELRAHAAGRRVVPLAARPARVVVHLPDDRYAR